MLQRKLIIVTLLLVVVTFSVMATRPPANEYTNLKVLPRNISSKDLSKIMVDDFTDGLGVGCNFCHASSKEKGSSKLDYASDEKPEKEIARSMMRMTLKLNKSWFQVKRPAIGAAMLAVSCTTCHNGQPHPGGAAGQ